MMTDRAKALMKSGPPSSSFSVNLDKWSDVMQSYLDGGFSYHTTMPTDAIRDFRDVFVETEQVPALPNSNLDTTSPWPSPSPSSSFSFLPLSSPSPSPSRLTGAGRLQGR